VEGATAPLQRFAAAANLNTRGNGFDERILEHDRRNAAECGGAPYAEAFEIEIM